MFDFGAFYPIDLLVIQIRVRSSLVSLLITVQYYWSQFLKQVSSPLQDFRMKREKKKELSIG